MHGTDCMIVESCSLSDLYYDLVEGSWMEVCHYQKNTMHGATVESFVGTDLIRVNSECCVGDCVASLGQYIEYYSAG